MADIRVERRGGISPWVWVVLAVVALVIAVVLLDYFGYIDLPFRMGASGAGSAVHSHLATLQEVQHGQG
jgi:hypothetical protein